MVQQVQGLDLAGVLNTVRFAEGVRAQREQQSLFRQQQQDKAQRDAQLQIALGQAAQGDDSALLRLDPQQALKLREQRQGLVQGQIDTQKKRGDLLSQRLEQSKNRGQLISRFGRALLSGNVSWDVARRRLESAGVGGLPEQAPTPEQIRSFVSEAEAFSQETPEVGKEIRLFAAQNGVDPQEILSNPDLANAFRQQQLRDKRSVAKAGAARVNVGRSELTGTNKTKAQETITANEELQFRLDKITELDPARFLTLGGRAQRFGMRQLARFGDGGIEAAAKALGMPPDEARQFLVDFRRFDQNVNAFFNRARKEITGAGASVQELEQIRESVLNSDLSPVEFEAALAEAQSEVEFRLRQARGQLRDGVSTESNDGPRRRGGQAGTEPRRRAQPTGIQVGIQESQRQQAAARLRELDQDPNLTDEQKAEILNREFGGR